MAINRIRRSRKRLKNEWADRPPNAAEIKAAQKLAKKVSVKLYNMMEAKANE
jgi:hypothetical protein